MNGVLTQKFIQLISTNTGLHIREQDREDLHKKIYARMKLLNFSEPEKYYQLLKTEKDQKNFSLATVSKSEWKELTLLLTTDESYFFRDKGQISLLKNRILPEFIERKKKTYFAEGEAKPTLRIWSAGCSTGEEPYSLAVLVKELIPDSSKWNILILGTDINPESIEKSKRGIYNSWSFRMVDPDLQNRYFHQKQKGWEVDQQIRSMVTFRSGNLVRDHFPSSTSNIYNMDIILCRNVFIYFDFDAISPVLKKFYNTLRPGGYLIAGHTELHGQNLGQLQAKAFPESLAYQRSEHKRENSCIQVSSSSKPSLVAAIPPTPTKTEVRSEAGRDNLSETATKSVLSRAESFFNNSAYALAIKEAEQVIKQHPQHSGAYYLMAQALANLGNYEQAVHCCQQALQLNSLSLESYYLLVHIAEEQEDVEKAKNLLKTIIYLAPTSIPAYLKLGSIYGSEGDLSRARTMHQTALELLKKLPVQVPVEHHSEMSVGELLLCVEKLLTS